MLYAGDHVVRNMTDMVREAPNPKSIQRAMLKASRRIHVVFDPPWSPFGRDFADDWSFLKRFQAFLSAADVHDGHWTVRLGLLLRPSQ